MEYSSSCSIMMQEPQDSKASCPCKFAAAPTSISQLGVARRTCFQTPCGGLTILSLAFRWADGAAEFQVSSLTGKYYFSPGCGCHNFCQPIIICSVRYHELRTRLPDGPFQSITDPCPTIDCRAAEVYCMRLIRACYHLQQSSRSSRKSTEIS